MAEDFGLKATVTADSSGYKKGLTDAQNATKKFSSTLSGMIQGLGKNGLVGALGAVGLASSGLTATLGAVKKIAQTVAKAVNECTEAYKNQLLVERALDTAIENSPFITGQSSQALKDFASEMQRVSNIGDEEIIPMMTKLIASGRTEAEVMQIIATATDMSASGAISFETAITQLNQTMNGSVGRLGQQYAQLQGLTEEELKNGKAVEILGDKYKGLAQATIDTSKQLKNIKGDFKEAIGEFTLPTSDMWNRFWSGFYEKGIEVINLFNEHFDKTIVGKGIAGSLETELKKLTDARERRLYSEDEIHLLSDQQVKALKDYLESLKKLNDEQQVLLKTAQDEIEARAFLANLYAEMDKEEAERQKKLQEQKDLEQTIIDLKQKYNDKIKEQKAQWDNILQVTGTAVSNEEKLKFYEDQLVAIMTESGGQITKNNQYYKDQMAIIEALRATLVEVKEVVEETAEVVAEETEKYKTLFDLIREGFANSLKKQEEMVNDWSSFADTTLTALTNGFSEMFMLIGQSLVEDSIGFKDFASVAIRSIQEILKGLSAQLTALATISLVTKQYGTAIKATAGATAALASAGALGGIANKMQQVNEATESANGSLEKFKENLQAIYNGEYASRPNTFSLVISQANSSIKEMRLEADRLYEIASQPLTMIKVADGNGGLKEVAANSKRNREIRKANEDYSKMIEAIQKATIELVKSVQTFSNETKQVVDNNKSVIESYQEYYTSISKYNELWLKGADIYDQVAYTMISSGMAVGDITKTITFQLEKYKAMMEAFKNEMKANAQTLTTSMYESFTSVGKNIGENIFNNILSGAGKTSFMKGMRDYIKKYVLQMAIYTESFTDKLADIGSRLVDAITSGSSRSLTTITKEISNLYDETARVAEQAEKVITKAFGNIEESVSSFGETITSFLESIQDLGGDIASQIVDGLSEGLSQSNFLDSMKKWIRNMMIQMVVYTDAMKTEVQEIGRRISQGITKGFTQTDLHEIRRDLSYIFDQATKKVGTIDTMLDGVFGYANGTNSAPSGLAIVGEAGPELVKFRGGEQVLNNRNTQKLIAEKGNAGSTFNVNFYETKDTTAFAMMSQLKQYQQQMVFNGVL